MRSKAIAFAFAVLLATPAFAQVDVRPFFLFSAERFSASSTFHAVLQSDVATPWGGGADLVIRRRFFVGVTLSHFSKDGQRVFVNNGDVFRLGIPVRLSSTPLEVSAGYRFHPRKWPVVPYAGAGVGSYSYNETSDFAAAGDDVHVRHAGVLLVGGAEVRLAKWVSLGADVEYTHVPGFLGQSGASKDLGDTDFGGVAGRLRIIISR